MTIQSRFLSIGLLVAAPAISGAQQPLPQMSQLKEAMSKAVLAHVRPDSTFGTVRVEPMEFKIMRVRSNYATGRALTEPEVKLIWAGDVTPLVNCSRTPSERARTVEVKTRNETTVSQTQRLTASATVEISADIGVVSGSIAATVEASAERGESRTVGTERSVSDEYTKTLPPMSGVRIGYAGFQRTYVNAPYEVDLVITRANLTSPRRGFLPIMKDEVPLTAQGTFSGKYWLGDLGIAEFDMTENEIQSACGSAGPPTPSARGNVRGVAGPTGAVAPLTGTPVPKTVHWIKQAKQP